jgi:prepilin signal peptidase PulO-like enzyme (type II secretory pathway)
VCIVRIPEKLSIVMPPSHCPTCKKPICFLRQYSASELYHTGGPVPTLQGAYCLPVFCR